MNETETLPLILPTREIEADNQLRLKLANSFSEERQVVIHCFCFSELMRIWKTTFLFPKEGGRKSELVHAHRISFYPVWTKIEKDVVGYFVLYFTGLPKDCDCFDLVEQIPEPGGFIRTDIPRSENDVYYIVFD